MTSKETKMGPLPCRRKKVSSKVLSPHEFQLRRAEMRDLDEIYRIWCLGMQAQGTAVPQEHLHYKDSFRKKLLEQDKVFGVWVAESSAQEILGWTALFPLGNNPLLRSALAEGSLYVCPQARGKGVATALLKYRNAHAQASALRYIVAFIRQDNQVMLDICRKTGYQQIGQLPEAQLFPAFLLLAYEVPLLNCANRRSKRMDKK